MIKTEEVVNDSIPSKSSMTKIKEKIDEKNDYFYHKQYPCVG